MHYRNGFSKFQGVNSWIVLNKDPYIVPDKASLVILDGKSGMCMDNICKDTEHTRHISRNSKFCKEWWKEKGTSLINVREVWNWQTLKLIMLVIMN